MSGVPAVTGVMVWRQLFGPSALTNRPVIAFAVVALITLLGGGVWYVRYRRRPPAATLRRCLGRKDEIAVLMHPNPDPDAMASALGVQHLATQVGTDSTLYYSGEIRHPENRAFRTVLDVDLECIDNVGDIDPDAVVLVDHNEPRGFTGSGGIDPYAVVDHHPGCGEGEAFTDVRPEYGACATIVAEYLEDVGADPNADDVETALTTTVATGLLYGILSDTKNLTRGVSDAEFDACSYLYPAVDDAALDRIANPQVDADVIELQCDAVDELDMEPPYAISDVGTVENIDAIPWAADELMHFERISTVIVIGDKDGTIHFSGRSRDDRVHIGRVLERAVEDIPMAGAGGHARMGGGQVSIAHMNGLGPSDGITREELHDRFFAAMMGED